MPPALNGERRARKCFHTRKDAEQFASDLRARKENYGIRLAQVPERLRHEALECEERLKAINATLTEATVFFIQHREATRRSCTVADLIAKVIEAKKLAARSKRYLADVRLIGGDFAKHDLNKFVCDVIPTDVDNWVGERKLSPTTRNNRLRTLSLAFSYTVKRDRCSSNPIDRVERATERNRWPVT